MNAIVAQLAAEPWAMEPTALSRLFAQLASVPDEVLAKAPQSFHRGDEASAGKAELDIRDGVAHIPIKGVIMKSVPWIYDYFGVAATSTVAVQEQLARAVEDPRVTSIVLDIESPGGVVKGVAELADDVKAASELKPVHTHATDLMASAAYWIGSQANSVSINGMGTAGSIGVYSVIYDASRAYDRIGVKAHVVTSHELKGVGVEGAPVTTAQLADVQRMIDQYTNRFVEAVARGRRTSAEKARESATGQVWLGDEAVQRGLVDAVRTASEAHAAAMKPAKQSEEAKVTTAPSSALEDKTMSQTNEPQRLKALEDENTRLKAESEQNAAKAAVAEASIKALRDQQREALIAKHQDRVAPAALEAVRTLGKSFGDDLAAFEGYLKGLPVVTRPAAVGGAPVVDLRGAPSVEDGTRDFAKKIGMADAQLAKFSQVKEFRHNGDFVLEDGRIVTRAELLQ